MELEGQATVDQEPGGQPRGQRQVSDLSFGLSGCFNSLEMMETGFAIGKQGLSSRALGLFHCEPSVSPL